jgi:hypothetical protein
MLDASLGFLVGSSIILNLCLISKAMFSGGEFTISTVSQPLTSLSLQNVIYSYL